MSLLPDGNNNGSLIDHCIRSTVKYRVLTKLDTKLESIQITDEDEIDE